MSRLTELERLDIGNNDFTEIPEGKRLLTRTKGEGEGLRLIFVEVNGLRGSNKGITYKK